VVVLLELPGYRWAPERQSAQSKCPAARKVVVKTKECPPSPQRCRDKERAFWVLAPLRMQLELRDSYCAPKAPLDKASSPQLAYPYNIVLGRIAVPKSCRFDSASDSSLEGRTNFARPNPLASCDGRLSSAADC
jgi:hypothetical protein